MEFISARYIGMIYHYRDMLDDNPILKHEIVNMLMESIGINWNCHWIHHGIQWNSYPLVHESTLLATHKNIGKPRWDIRSENDQKTCGFVPYLC